MPDRDEHYIKYRVFHEPSDDDVTDIEDIGHPVPIKVEYLQEQEDTHGFETWGVMDEVEGAFYVLRPEGDHHARVAIAAYAYSCRIEYPHLAADLIKMVEEIEWEEQTGQHRDDFPLETEDYIVQGERLNDNVVEILRKKAIDG